MINKSINILNLVLLIFLLTGCISNATNQGAVILPSPEPDKALIYGKLLSSSHEPQVGIVVRLAEVYRGASEEGTFVLDEASSPSTISEQDGHFFFYNVEPGEYVIFVGVLHAQYKIVSESDQTPIVYKVGPGESFQVETIIVDFEDDL